MNLLKKSLNNILNSVDTDHNGAINYTEFIAATLNVKLITDRKKLKKFFDLIDTNGDGTINYKDLDDIIHDNSNQFVTASLIKEAIKEWDLNKDGEITFDEFYRSITHTTT